MTHRAWRLLLATLLLLAAAGCNIRPKEKPALPIPLESVLPPSWEPVGELTEINIDEDKASEWLLRFRYDGGLIGAVIYDTQSKADPYRVAEKLPHQPAFLIAYPLLPNTEDDYGLGYIGNDKAEYKTVDTNANGRPDVLLLLGYWRTVPTRLTMAWWIDAKEGYGVAHVVSDEALQFDEPGYWKERARQLKKVITRRRMNDRSNLCERHEYRVNWTDHRFILTRSEITFCQGRPQDPVYPEGTVLSFLLQLEKAVPPQQQGSVFDRLMTQDGIKAWEKVFGDDAFVRRKQLHVLRIEYDGPLGDQVEVRTTHQDSKGRHRLIWQLKRQRPREITGTVTWRITDVRRDEEVKRR